MEGSEYSEPHVFISYQWDMQSRVEDIRRILESNGIHSWADMSSAGVSNNNQQRGHSGVSTR